MKRLLCVALLCVSTVASAAGLIWRNGELEVTLFKTPCVDARVLSHIHPSNRPLFQAGKAKWASTEMEGCWALHPDGEGEIQVWFTDETGGFGVLAREQFVR